MTIPYAHSTNSAGVRQPLDDHLRAVAELARHFASAFGAGELASYAGLLHDSGKLDPAWQRYLLEAEASPRSPRDPQHPTHKLRGPDHKGAGAALAHSLHLEPLALAIKGHHGGLPALAEMKSWLGERAADAAVRTAIAAARERYPALHSVPPTLIPPAIRDRSTSELFLRMVFSALVDADFLDTERHFAGDDAPDRAAPPLAALIAPFEAYQRARTGQREDPVNTWRHALYQDCLAGAELSPGFFRLTAPTGIGKTRSSLAFALAHAQRYDLRRVIYAIPYTSITEQTAAQFRAIFTDHPELSRAVLEHHSAIVTPDDPDNTAPADLWARLAAENWDAPLIVTTTVQLFESLMAASTSACRKLHNIARSVLILDEAQMLPTHLLAPILEILRFLVAHGGVSVVLCTATQPALDDSPQFQGLPDIREIVREPARLFQALKRVEYLLPRPGELWTWQRVAEEMRASPQALAVVNTRPDALALLRALDDPDALHLSTWMCGAHRRATLAEVRHRLATGAPCRLISTQVIEAGVDVDFPLVLRALGPLDRIVQAAGRCNREGRLSEPGRVIVFEPAEGKLPRGAYAIGTEETRLALQREEHADTAPADLHDPAIYHRYFERWYQNLNPDEPGILALRQSFDYPAVASGFQMIRESTTPVIVRWQHDDHEARVIQLLHSLTSHPARARDALRALQPYMVSLSPWHLQQAQQRGLVAEVAELPGLYEWRGQYDPTTGIVLNALDGLDGPAAPEINIW